MAQFPGYSITVRRYNETHDIKSFTQGFSSQADFTFGRRARFRTTLTATNSTGAFTPAEGGGTGTFKDVLWFESYLVISVFGTGDIIFEGLISDFDIADNGIESTVTIKAVDWMTLTRSDVFDVSENTVFDQAPASQMYSFFNGDSGYGSGAETPKLGYTSATYLFDIADGVPLKMGRPAASNVTVLDAVTQMYIAPLPCVVLPNEIALSGATTIVYKADVLGRSLTYEDTAEYVFTQNPTSDELPFKSVTPNFDRNMITSNTSYESGMAGVGTATASNGATKQKYGQRNRRFTGTGHVHAGNDTADEYGMLKSASFWTTRQKEARYVPRKLVTSVETVEAYNDSTAAIDKLGELMSAKYGMWHPVQVTYTPTGGSVVTADCVISGRTINATPAQTTIILNLLPAADYQSFRLDSTVIGVLAGVANPTTYDDSGTTYDDVAEPYDGSGTTIEGFRLG